MKLPLAGILLLFFLPLFAQSPSPMTNQLVVQLVQSGVSAGEVSRLIRAAPAVSFSLTPADTDKLITAGVSEQTIKMMAARELGAPFVPGPMALQTASVLASRPAGPQVDIPEATKVKVRLEQSVSSATAEEGQPVQLVVSEDITIDDAVVIPQGSVVNGTVVNAVPKRRMGRTGKLDFSIDTIIAPDGGKIPVRYSVIKKEGGSHAARNGVITAGVAVVFWPAAPFLLLMKGKDTTFSKGMTFEVFTDTKYSHKPRKPGSAVAARTGAVAITSDPSSADIEVDGIFGGNTPSTLQLAPGQHSIKISKALKTWQRTMDVESGSNITLNVALVAVE